MKYLSVCSGIEAASVAWHPLGWQAIGFAEIDTFPSALLKHHYPSVPNFGDVTKFKDWPDATFDVLVGGTPCQSFSVAGLRKGLDDPRGNLALTYLAILDRYRPAWCCWENVPGVLSSGGGRDFGAFVGGLGQLGYGWAYRILDAQFFGVAQRRRRVFVVGYLGDWRRAAAVLFDGESLQGHPAPRREAGQGIANAITERPDRGGGNSEGQRLIPDVVGALSDGAHNGGGLNGQDAYTGRIFPVIGGSFDLAHSLRADGFDASEDGTGRGTPIVPIDMRQASRGEKVTNNRAHGSGGPPGVGVGEAGDPAFTVTDRVQAIAFQSNSSFGTQVSVDLCPTMQAQQTNGSGMPAVAFDARQSDVIQYGEKTGPLDTCGFTMGIQRAMAVRRLTPRECERLQGFPDDYTLIPYRGKPAADGPRYKALGNSMAVPCMSWIGRRLQFVQELIDGTND